MSERAYGQLFTSKTWGQTMTSLREEFRKWGVEDVQYPILRLSQGQVVVRFVPAGGSVWQDIRCDKWPNCPERNLRAIFLAVQAVRLMDQRGIGQMLAQASAHLALPAPRGYATPQEVLGIASGDTPKQMVDKARQATMAAHPDKGGTAERFKAVREAAEKLGLV